MIPLVGSPPVPQIPNRDILTADDSTFLATLGSWVAVGSGCSVARDTGIKLTGSAASMLLTTDSNGDYCETTAITGRTFTAGRKYWCIAAVRELFFGELMFGLLGTDEVTTGPFTAGPVNGWVWISVPWVPSANRTGVKIRFKVTGGGAITQYIGQVKVYSSETVPFLDYEDAVIMPNMESGGNLRNNSIGGGLQFYYTSNGASLYAPDENAGIDVNSYSPSDESFIYAYSPADAVHGDLSESGMEWDVGPDYVGWYLSELDATHAQFYPYEDGQFNQLRHWPTSGWSVSDDGVVDGRIEAYFEAVLTKAGTLSVASNVAQYYVLPGKIRVDEVRCHVGTAPTGQALIVDIHAGGTTIFTTQGNRPSIAAGTNDDTSGAPDGGTSVAKDTVITVDVDQVGSGTAGSDLFVTIRGRYIW